MKVRYIFFDVLLLKDLWDAITMEIVGVNEMHVLELMGELLLSECLLTKYTNSTLFRNLWRFIRKLRDLAGPDCD